MPDTPNTKTIHLPPESKGEAAPGGRLKGRRVLVLGGGQMDIGEADTPIGNGRAICVLFAQIGRASCRERVSPYV